eukprot:scaffold8173_cov66-Phaeocystis_antarctica.AAC.6
MNTVYNARHNGQTPSYGANQLQDRKSERENGLRTDASGSAQPRAACAPKPEREARRLDQTRPACT